MHGSAWYYIACSGCNTKATKSQTSLMCTKCGKVNIAGVAQCELSPQYSIKLLLILAFEFFITGTVQRSLAVFVILSDAGRELTGKYAS